MSDLWPYLAALIPVAGMAWLFWLVMKSLVEADRSERRAHSQWERDSKPREEPLSQQEPHSGERDAEKRPEVPRKSS